MPRARTLAFPFAAATLASPSLAAAAFLSLAAAGAHLLACGGEPAPTVEVAEAQRAPLRVVVTTNGKVEPVEHAEVRAALDGRVQEIPEPGTRLQQGDAMLAFDPDSVASALASARSERLAAQASLRAARDELALARRRFETDRRLHEQGALAAERLDESRVAFEETRARASALESEVPLRTQSLDHRIRDLEQQLEGATVRAPVTGTVYRTEARPGQQVQRGEPVLWIADLDRLRVRANVDQVDLGRVSPGASVRVSSNAYPGRTWSGKVTEIIPNVVVKESRAVAEGLAVLEPPLAGLVPGMTVDVEVIVAEEPDALQVPAEAVVTREGESFVWKVEEGRVRRTPVSVGASSVTAAQVQQGLAPGDVVVVGPPPGLEEGARVDARAGQRGAS